MVITLPAVFAVRFFSNFKHRPSSPRSSSIMSSMSFPLSCFIKNASGLVELTLVVLPLRLLLRLQLILSTVLRSAF